jgi:hypothetical protein
LGVHTFLDVGLFKSGDGGYEIGSLDGRERNTFPRKTRETADPSAALGMTKGRAMVRWKAVNWTEGVFITLGGPQSLRES